MNRIKVLGALGALGVLAAGVGVVLAQAPANMSFFVTSKNPGKGGNLGGLEGADRYCQELASAVGAGNKTWHAFLSTDKVNAKDRIGNGPWYNVKGQLIAQNVGDLLGANNKISAETALNEKGGAPNYLAGDPPAPTAQPLQHDMMTGTNEDGTSSGQTCNNWTDGGDDAKATLGHADRKGRSAGVNSWVNVHPSQGCSLEKLAPTGSAGLFYCFAVN
ncbi:MAG TPA: DUF1554 domain-containing protein [Gammaproteobacteria bacterium]|nr:DUF1554 domain-containing protein [Gammaproteobacteria bacterium]